MPTIIEAHPVANAFSPDYTSELVPFKPTQYKRPRLDKSHTNLTFSIATHDDRCKRAKLLKASI